MEPAGQKRSFLGRRAARITTRNVENPVIFVSHKLYYNLQKNGRRTRTDMREELENNTKDRQHVDETAMEVALISSQTACTNIQRIALRSDI